MVNYIVSDAKGQLNYPTGSPVTLDGERGNDVQRYQLFPPGQDPYQLIAQDNRVTLRDTRQAGNYRLRGRRGIDVIRGISANLESHQTALPRMPSENLNAIFGESRYQLVRENAEIERAQGRNRVGREFYPVLMVMLAMVVVLEQLLANRFYTPRAARE